MQSLRDEGFVRPLELTIAVAPTAAQTTPPGKAPADDVERLAMARNFMANTTRAYIGTNGSSLINKIDDCADLESLRHQYNAWREAIQLSREGRKDIGDLESKLAALLS